MHVELIEIVLHTHDPVDVSSIHDECVAVIDRLLLPLDTTNERSGWYGTSVQSLLMLHHEYNQSVW
jgi:hypothetical protein